MTPVLTFPQTFAHAAWLLRRGLYLDAAEVYLSAAEQAPSDRLEGCCLNCAWVASERARGAVSELEVRL